MLLTCVLASLAASTALSFPSNTMAGVGNAMCGYRLSDGYRAASEQLGKEIRFYTKGRERVHQGPINVRVYAHVVTSGAKGRQLGNDDIKAQMDVLNKDYAPAQISFSLASTDWTVSPNWSVNEDVAQMRRQLRQGTYRDLNLYFLLQIKVFGYCSLPEAAQPGSDAFFDDGCTVRADTVPGGGAANYNLGRTAVHEVGHWLGLLHTFEGGCDGDGDYVEDTPAQLISTNGCPTSRDSCPAQPGLDPVHNFMDYSFDWCYEGFTQDQIQRMHAFWDQFRGG